MFVPITPPLNLLAAQLEKIPSVTSLLVPSQYFRNCTLFSTQGLAINYLNVFEWEKSLATATSASHALNTSSGSYHICVAILRVGLLTKTDW